MGFDRLFRLGQSCYSGQRGLAHLWGCSFGDLKGLLLKLSSKPAKGYLQPLDLQTPEQDAKEHLWIDALLCILN